MTIDHNNFFLKLSILTVSFGFSFLISPLALATPTEQQKYNDDGNWVHINGEGIIDAPLSIVLDHLKDVQKSEPTIPGLKLKKILQQISDNERIDYDHYELPWPFQDRYTIYRAREKIVSDWEILLTVSSLDNFPFEEKDKVALIIKKGTFRLESLPEDETKTKVIVKLTLDPGGFLPIWLINLNANSWSNDLFQNLRINTRSDVAKQKISKTNLTRKANTNSSSNF